MWLRKAKNNAQDLPHPGQVDALDGLEAAWAQESSACDAVLIENGPVFTAIDDLLSRTSPDGAHNPTFVEKSLDARHAIAALSGLSASGLRATAFLAGLEGSRDALAAAAGKHLPFVVHLICRAMTRQAASLNAGHDDYHAVADTGCFELFAANPQQVSDFAVIAHWIAERSLTPGICAQDLYETSHSVQNLLIQESGFVHELLGASGDVIDAPTPSQKILFGNTRRRVPMLVDPDRPVGLGGTQDRESYAKAIAAGRAFLTSHLDAMIDEAFAEFGRLTGRFYEKVSGYRVDDADVVVVAQGSIVEELCAVADHLRKKDKVKAGVISVNVFRPFPGAAITRMLKGKKAVTVLERTDAALSEDLPILAQIRSSIDKALDNGMSREAALPYPSHDSYGIEDKPQLFSGLHGLGTGGASFSELIAIYRNMLPRKGRKTRFYVGASFDRYTRRFPHLETLQQQLAKKYPKLAALSLSAAEDTPIPEPNVGAMQIHALSIQDALSAGNLAARTLSEDLKQNVKTWPEGGLEPSLEPASLILAYTDDATPLRGRPASVGVILVSGEQLVESLPEHCDIEDGGTVIVETNRKTDTAWDALSPRLVRWFSDKKLRLLALDARSIASETAAQPNTIDQLAIWALLGAWFDTSSNLKDTDLARFVDKLSTRLATRFGEDHKIIDEITKATRRGAAEVVEVSQVSWDVEQPSGQVDAPWTVKEVTKGDGTVFDPARFWHSVGYLYDTGQAHNALTDPYLATGIMPARSSAFRNMASYRLRVPSWLAENCTGCGLCWTHCPESALPATIQSASALIRTAMAACEAKGQPMVQMGRIADHLAKQTNRMIAKGGPSPTVSASALLETAFAELVVLMKLEGNALDAVTKEFHDVQEAIGEFLVSRNEKFFDEPDKAEKGTGTLLSIALNPLSCTACGLCVEVCADDALEWVEQTPEKVAEMGRAWEFQASLPAVPEEVLARHITEEPETRVNTLLDKHVYRSLVGGDGSLPGNGARTAVHLLTAAVESVMRPRFKAHIDKLTGLIESLEKKIQGEVSGTVEINDFDQFGRQLDKLNRPNVTASNLTDLLSDGKTALDGKQLGRLNNLLRKVKDQRDRYVGGGSGAGRARMVLTIDTGAASFWHGTYPYNPHPHPWICQLDGDGPALGEGVFVGLTQRLAEEFKTCRLATLELDDAYDPAKHDAMFERFDRDQFTEEEWDLVPPVIVVGSQSTTGLRDVSRLLEKGYLIKVAVINTDGPAIVGAAEAKKAETSITRMALAQGDAFVLQSTIGHPGHLLRGVARGIGRRGPALFHIYAPDPNLSGIAPDKVAEQAQLGFESRAWPLVEFDGAELTLDGNPEPERAWTTTELSIREPSGEESTLTEVLTLADWAVHETRFQKYFRLVSKGHLNEQMKPLAEYLELDAGDRQGIEPFVNVADESGRRLLAIVTPEMVASAEKAASFWRKLQGMTTGGVAQAGAQTVDNAPAQMPAAVPEAPATHTTEVDPALYERVTDRLLQLSGYGEDPEFFKRSLRQFVTRNPVPESEDQEV